MKKRNLTQEELNELNEITKVIRVEMWKLSIVKQNVRRLTNGKRMVRDLEETIKLFEEVKNQWVSQKLYLCGYPKDTKVKIDLKTGKIKETKNEAVKQ